MKECERDREFKEWQEENGHFVDELQETARTCFNAGLKEARKGYVELKKVEEILEKHTSEFGMTYTCEAIDLKAIDVIKELAEKR